MMYLSDIKRQPKEEDSNCDSFISVPLDVFYGFNINPKIALGEVKTYAGRRKICRKKDGRCVLYQLICVEVPVDIDVEIDCPDDFPNIKNKNKE